MKKLILLILLLSPSLQAQENDLLKTVLEARSCTINVLGFHVCRFQIGDDLDFEITGNYRSEVRNVQSILSDNYFMDLGLRKKLMKGRTILNLSVRDVFASRNMESETNQPGFYLYNFRERGRFITFGVSFGFGKGEAMEFSGQKRF